MNQSLYIIDDDADIRQYICTITDSLGVMNQCYASASEFLLSFRPEFQGCILSDVIMPDMTGLEFQEQLIIRDIKLPLILMSSFGNISIVKTALKRGAIDFLEKPLNIQELTLSVQSGLQLSEKNSRKTHEIEAILHKIKSLSKREKEVFCLLKDGADNQKIAQKLSISIRTIETHRYKIMKKMAVNSLIELTHLFKDLPDDYS